VVAPVSIEARLQVRREAFTLDVDLALPGRGINGLFGPSGCGKTTLLRAIAGLEPDASGTLTVNGETWQSDAVRLPTHCRALGFVFQEASLFAHLDVEANLHYGLKRIPAGQRRIQLNDIVELLGIARLRGRRPHQLSGGERQRVAIARALATSPRLLLMDEPLAALDTPRRHEIMPYLESLHRELSIPVLYVSHAVDEIARLADHLVLLDAGRVTATGDVFTLFARTDLPLAHGDRAAALIQARVGAHDGPYRLTRLDFDGGALTVPGLPHAPGQAVRVRVFARDVSLTLAAQHDTSILNILPVRIETLTPDGEAQLLVRLAAHDTRLLARITRRSADQLGLAPEMDVFAQVKSVAILP
jgi:molybdate transport system ATP-binding protein